MDSILNPKILQQSWSWVGLFNYTSKQLDFSFKCPMWCSLPLQFCSSVHSFKMVTSDLLMPEDLDDPDIPTFFNEHGVSNPSEILFIPDSVYLRYFNNSLVII